MQVGNKFLYFASDFVFILILCKAHCLKLIRNKINDEKRMVKIIQVGLLILISSSLKQVKKNLCRLISIKAVVMLSYLIKYELLPKQK